MPYRYLNFLLNSQMNQLESIVIKKVFKNKMVESNNQLVLRTRSYNIFGINFFLIINWLSYRKYWFRKVFRNKMVDWMFNYDIELDYIYCIKNIFIDIIWYRHIDIKNTFKRSNDSIIENIDFQKVFKNNMVELNIQLSIRTTRLYNISISKIAYFQIVKRFNYKKYRFWKSF